VTALFMSPSSNRGQECVEPYLHASTRLHGVVLR